MRSQNDEMKLGSVEGKYKMLNKDHGGVVEGTTVEARDELSWIWYGMTECPVMDLPTGGKFVPVDSRAMTTPPMAMYEVG